MIFTIIFSIVWGLMAAYLGIGWHDGDIFTASLANLVPISAVFIAEIK